MNVYFDFDSAKGAFLPPVYTQFPIPPQKLVPYDAKMGRAFCEAHQKWEAIFNFGSELRFSCGASVLSRLAPVNCWCINRLELFFDAAGILCARKILTYVDVHDFRVNNFPNSYSKFFDLSRGKISHRRNFDFNDIPPFFWKEISSMLENQSAGLFGVRLSVPSTLILNYVKFPTCPSFSLIYPRVDDIEKFNVRADLNLFKDFCALMKIKESKRLRKDFLKEPRTIFLHAMAQFLRFRDANAISFLVNNKTLFERFASDSGYLRFSLRRRCVYVKDSFYKIEGITYQFNMLNALRLWVQNALTDKSQIVVAKRLAKFLSTEDFHTLSDTAAAYDKCARDLPVPLHERILKEGFTSEMHDQIMELFNLDIERGGGYTSDAEKVKNKKIEYDTTREKFELFIRAEKEFGEIEYSAESVEENRLLMMKAEKNAKEKKDDDIVDEDFDLENQARFDAPKLERELILPEIKSNLKIGAEIRKKGGANDYFFCLPRDTDELYEISSQMRNCVGYLYRDKALSGASTIVVLIKRNKMHACIEVVQDKKTFEFRVVQSSGPCNAPILPKLKSVIEEWKNRTNIK